MPIAQPFRSRHNTVFCTKNFSKQMTGQPSQQRKPPDWPNPAAPYASLRNNERAPQGAKEAAATGPSKDAGASDFDAETTKLKALREALWAAFEAGPDAGLPNTLIDLTIAYTGALRLQLNLKALKAGQRKVQPAARPSYKPSTE